MRIRLLVVEASEPERRRLQQLFQPPDFVVRAERETGKALAASVIWQPEVILLSWDVPGAEVLLDDLRRDARSAAVPVFLLASEEDSVLGALQRGAVSYLVRPCVPEELVARVRAVARHFGAATGREGVLRFGPLVLDRPGRRVYLGGRPVTLGPKEFETLELLAESAGRVLTRRQILERVWGFESDSGPRNVDYQIFYLRKKLGPKISRAIDTVSRVGYCFRPEAL